MTAPPSAPDFSDMPNRFALLPLPSGDVQLIFREPRTDKWIVCRSYPMGLLADEHVDKLVHLAPIVTEVPEDLIAQFRKQLGMGDDE